MREQGEESVKMRGVSLMVERQSFLIEDGGSIPTTPHGMRIEVCQFSDVRKVFETFHYKGGHMGGGISWCFRLHKGGITYGGAVVGKPRHGNKYVGSVEIRRMACTEDAPKNSESYFLSKIIWWIRKNTEIKSVLSYADASVGHKGIIYKAANFKRIGETAPTKHVYWNGVRYHPRSLTIERPYSHKLRAAVKSGEALVTIEKPKSVWIYEIKSADNSSYTNKEVKQ